MTDLRPEHTSPATPLSAEESVSDGSLLQRYLRGSADAATMLYFRYADHLQALAAANLSPALACRVDPADIVQSVFRTFFRRAPLGNYEVPDGNDLWKLFLVIALNKIRSAGTYHRALRRDVRRTSQAVSRGQSAGGMSGENETALTVLHMVIEEILEDLPASHRTVVERRIEGYEVTEIAPLVQRSKRSVERVLRDFRERLRAVLNEDE